MSHYRRFKKLLDSHLVFADGRVIAGNTASLSTEGANLVVPERISAGEHCLFEVHVNEPDTIRTFKLSARVTRCSQQTDIPGYGVQLVFIDPPEQYLTLIDALN